MTRNEILEALTEQQALGLTAWAEARGDWRQGGSSIEERLAVMLICRNRRTRFKAFNLLAPDYRMVCLARKQFSCWNDDPSDPNHLVLMALAEREVKGQLLNDAVAEETLWLAGGIIEGTVLDFTKGCDHYYAPKAMKPAGTVPVWARGKQPVVQVGDQVFFKLT